MELSGPLTYLFGGDKPWLENTWVASDDRVRGGISQSYLQSSGTSGAVRFYGDLDITTLEGAGFASQRSPDPLRWDLSGYQGLRLKVNESDGKKYALILKDQILPTLPDGREQSTLSWEYDFTSQAAEFDIAFEDLKPTYRGSPQPDAEPLDLTDVKRISIMMRSFFGEQEGPFSLELQYIAATISVNESIPTSSYSQPEAGNSDSSSNSEKRENRATDGSWFQYLRGFFKRGP
ncbi:CIA30 family protein [Biscogniauxia marginata]|nr:CIA30 family protein [Biscogniauxia marginata]